MEVAVKELNAEGKESALVTHGKHDGDECNHFTIRYSHYSPVFNCLIYFLKN